MTRGGNGVMSDSRPGWPEARLSKVSGETTEKLRWYVDAQLLHRSSPGEYAADSLHRLQLIRHAHRRGISDEALAVAVKEQGDLLAVFEELGDGSPTDQTMAQVATEARVPLHLLDELVDLLGVSRDDTAFTDDVEAVQLLQQALDLGVPVEALIQLIRVFVDTSARMADAEVRIFHDYVHERFRADGLRGEELLRATEAIGKPALTLVEPAIRYFHRRAYHRANRADLLRHLAEATTPPPAVPGEAVATVMFVDLAGFTPLTVTLGDSGVAEVLQRFASTVRRESDRHAGRIIKQIGDAFMLVFDRPRDSIQFGVAVMRECGSDADFPPLHVGAHHGPLLYRDGDYFGNAVNLAARITSASEADQFLVTADLKATVAAEVDVAFTAIPPRHLKGLADPPALFAVTTS